jgi:hypothetical protein
MDMQRKIKLMGVGIGTEPVELSITVDGASVQTRPIHLIADRSAEKNARTVCVWNEAIDFAGTRHLKITVTKGEFWYISTLSNYMPLRRKTEPDTVISSGRVNYLPCYQQMEPEGMYLDPNANVTINGFSIAREVRDPSHKFRQWPWQLLPGTEFECDVMFSAGTTDNNIFDSGTVIDTVSYVADGIQTEFTAPEAGPQGPYGYITPVVHAVYVDDVRQNIQILRDQAIDIDESDLPDHHEFVDSSPNLIVGYDEVTQPVYVRFRVPPENGKTVRIVSLNQMGSPMRYVGF